MIEVAKNMRAIAPAKCTFTKQFFIEIFDFRSDPNSSVFFTELSTTYGRYALSQRPIDIGISYGDNMLEPLI